MKVSVLCVVFSLSASIAIASGGPSAPSRGTASLDPKPVTPRSHDLSFDTDRQRVEIRSADDALVVSMVELESGELTEFVLEGDGDRVSATRRGGHGQTIFRLATGEAALEGSLDANSFSFPIDEQGKLSRCVAARGLGRAGMLRFTPLIDLLDSVQNNQLINDFPASSLFHVGWRLVADACVGGAKASITPAIHRTKAEASRSRPYMLRTLAAHDGRRFCALSMVNVRTSNDSQNAACRAKIVSGFWRVEAQVQFNSNVGGAVEAKCEAMCFQFNP